MQIPKVIVERIYKVTCEECGEVDTYSTEDDQDARGTAYSRAARHRDTHRKNEWPVRKGIF